MNRWPMLYIHFALFNADIVTAIIYMDTAIFCSKPHCGLQIIRFCSHNGRLTHQWVWYTSYPLWVLFNPNSHSWTRCPFITFVLIFTGRTTGNAMQRPHFTCGNVSCSGLQADPNFSQYKDFRDQEVRFPQLDMLTCYQNIQETKYYIYIYIYIYIWNFMNLIIKSKYYHN